MHQSRIRMHPYASTRLHYASRCQNKLIYRASYSSEQLSFLRVNSSSEEDREYIDSDYDDSDDYSSDDDALALNTGAKHTDSCAVTFKEIVKELWSVLNFYIPETILEYISETHNDASILEI